ncbi:hypothetical protein [Telluribacter sp.]|uniref:hypothetical protein n=1 Tax=Telluribacter sp. TaxID=1978767 RepID=UPI002E14C169
MLAKLKEVPKLKKEAHSLLTQHLTVLNGQLIVEILQLFLQQQVTDIEVCRSVSILLASPNSFVSGKAYAFLTKVNPQDGIVKKRIVEYKEKHKIPAIE